MGKAIKYDPDIEQDVDAILNTRTLTSPKSEVEEDVDAIIATQLGPVEKITAPLVKGATTMLDLPGDVVAGAVNLGLKVPPGMEDFEVPSGGFTKAAEELGLTVPEDQLPKTPLRYGLQFGAEALIPSGLMFRAGKGITQEAIEQAPKIKKLFMSSIKDIGETARRNPKTFLAKETFLGTTTGVGFYVGQDKFPDSPIAQLLTTIGGGTLPQFVSKISPSGFVIRKSTQYAKALAHFLNADTTKLRNYARIQKYSKDPKKAAEQIGQTKELAKLIPGLAESLDPVDLTKDVDLFRVRAAILRKLPVLRQDDLE